MPRFQPGQSGNPQGRPKGIPTAAMRLRKAIADHLPEIIQQLVIRAREGDVAAASLLLSRALPPLRPEAPAQPLEEAGHTLEERAETVAQAALSGEVSPTAAADLMGILATQARIKELVELEGRIAALEAKQ